MIAFTINQFISAYAPMISDIKKHNLNTTDLIDAYVGKHEKQFKDLLKLSPNSKPFELVDFFNLCINLRSHLKAYDKAHYDIPDFFLNTKLGNGIITDFDVTRFSNNSILNIELKHMAKEEIVSKEQRLINKFKTQNHILKVIEDKDNKSKHIYNIVYFEKSNEFMMFNPKNSKLEDYDINSLVNILINGRSTNKNELLNLQPSDYIISPSKDFYQFINGEYLLTSHQQNVVNNIINNTGLYGIYGCAGSGKSLVAYDIIRKLSSKFNNILFIFCGHTENIHSKMNAYFDDKASFKPVNELRNEDINLNNYNYIFIDEAQKIYLPSFNILNNFINNRPKGTTLCFLYDTHQSLESGDLNNDLDKFLHKHGTCYKLGGKHNKSIRSNTIINEFIKAVMNKSRDISEISINKLYKHIDVKYFKSARDAAPYIYHLQSEPLRYKFITPTPNPDKMISCSVDKFKPLSSFLDLDDSNNTHSNIGTEWNKVVTYADENLNYISHSNQLHQTNDEHYNLVNELYVNMTRAVSKLTLLIINNKPLYKSILI